MAASRLFTTEMTLGRRAVFTPLIACAVLLVSNPAWATWSSFAYANGDGEARYGIKDGSSRLRLGLAKEKDANKTAAAMNKAEKRDDAAATPARKPRRSRDQGQKRGPAQ